MQKPGRLTLCLYKDGFHPNMEVIGLNTEHPESGLTEKILMYIANHTGKKTLLMDFFPVKHPRYSIGIKPESPLDCSFNRTSEQFYSLGVSSLSLASI